MFIIIKRIAAIALIFPLLMVGYELFGPKEQVEGKIFTTGSSRTHSRGSLQNEVLIKIDNEEATHLPMTVLYETYKKDPSKNSVTLERGTYLHFITKVHYENKAYIYHFYYLFLFALLVFFIAWSGLLEKISALLRRL